MFYFQADVGDPSSPTLFFGTAGTASRRVTEVFTEGDDPQEGGQPGGF